METGKIKISEVKKNNENPRRIKPLELMRLKKSIMDFPEMMEIRPIVIDEDNVVLGGNMRLRAMTELEYDEIHFIRVQGLDEEQKKEFIIKDNGDYGEWDWDMLTNDWDIELLPEWGLDVPSLGNVDSVREVNKGDEYEEWVGMPEFDVKEKPPTLVIAFGSERDRDDFVEKYEIQLSKRGGRAWSTHYPYKERGEGISGYFYE